MKATDIFFSYAHKDRDRIKPIIQAFTEWEWDVFYDREIDAGQDWEQVIEDRLQTMYAVIVAWSIHSIKSPWVIREATAGLERERLFSIKLDSEIELPEAFQKFQAADLSDWTGDPKDPIFKHIIRPLENQWTRDNDMALIRKLKIRPPLKLRKHASDE
jgi:hypothetical protein